MHAKCSQCGKEYQNRDALLKHLRQNHNEITTKQYKCIHCALKFANKRRLITHLKLHRERENAKKNRLLCPICPHLNKSYSALREHLKNIHKYVIKYQELDFKNTSEFESWKMKIEEEQQSMYVQDTAEKQLKNKTRMYYSCHRSYAPRIVDKYKKRSKMTGSNKFSRACPSSIIVTKYKNGCLSVIFYSTHIGHSCEMRRMRLNLMDRNLIAEKLAEGVPFQKVLEDVEESASSSNFRRIHLLKKKDLENIKRDFAVGYPIKKHDNEGKSLDIPEDNVNGQQLFDTSTSDLEDQEIQSKLEEILGLSEKIVLEVQTRSEIIKHLNSVITLMNENIKHDTNSNKHVEKQLSSLPAKKKRIINEEQLKLSVPESNSLEDYLICPDSRVLIIHTGFDHIYSCLSHN